MHVQTFLSCIGWLARRRTFEIQCQPRLETIFSWTIQASSRKVFLPSYGAVFAYLLGGWYSVEVFRENTSELSESPYNISSSSSVLTLKNKNKKNTYSTIYCRGQYTYWILTSGIFARCKTVYLHIGQRFLGLLRSDCWFLHRGLLFQHFFCSKHSTGIFVNTARANHRPLQMIGTFRKKLLCE